MRKPLAATLRLLLCARPSLPLAREKGEAFSAGDYTYVLLSDGTVEIKKHTGNMDRVEIPSRLDGHRVTSIGNEAFTKCPNLMLTVGRDSFAKQCCDEYSQGYIHTAP